MSRPDSPFRRQGGRQQGPAGADNAGAETWNRPANRRSGRRSAASLFLSEHSIFSLPASPFFRSFSPFRVSDTKLNRPVFILVFFCVLKALEAPETRGNAGKLRFGSAAKPIQKGIFPCSCSGRRPAPRIRSPLPSFRPEPRPPVGAEWRNLIGALSTPKAPAFGRRPSPAGFLRSLRFGQNDGGRGAPVEMTGGGLRFGRTGRQGPDRNARGSDWAAGALRALAKAHIGNKIGNVKK